VNDHYILCIEHPDSATLRTNLYEQKAPDYANNCLTAQIRRDAVGLVVYGRSLKVQVWQV
jgi:hypothetical protein